jgi:3-hydroxyisobutyrate dehydrogenase-like beta-hydroxyacid dehydrogenase
MAAGPQAHFDAVQPALAAMAQKLEYFGERPDLAAVYKLFGNAFILGIAATMADVLSIAKGSGVAPDDARRARGCVRYRPPSLLRGR